MEKALKAAVIGAALLFGGCAALQQERPDCRNAKAESLPYARSGAGDRTPAKYTQVQAYTLTPDAKTVAPCGRVTIRKTLSLKRPQRSRTPLKEVRDFYAQDGTLIVSSTEDITAQVPRSGAYRATLILPVPKTAPAGRYTMVSRIVLAPPGRQPVVLREARLAFHVVVPAARR